MLLNSLNKPSERQLVTKIGLDNLSCHVPVNKIDVFVACKM